MNSLKLLIFIELLATVVFSVVYFVMKIQGQNIPLTILPILLGIVFVTTIFAIYVIAPLAERFLG